MPLPAGDVPELSVAWPWQECAAKVANKTLPSLAELDRNLERSSRVILSCYRTVTGCGVRGRLLLRFLLTDVEHLPCPVHHMALPF
jgi:hypothetical protein